MAEQFENNYTTTLNGAINDSTTTIVVTAGPTTMTGQFRIKIDNEIILVGSVSGTTFSSCTRGVEGTSAASHSNGATVTHVLTAGSLDQAIDDAGTALITHKYIGTNTVGASTETPTANRVYLKKVVMTTSGVLSSVEAYMHESGASAQVSSYPAFGIFTDVAGVPSKLLRWSAPSITNDVFYPANDANPTSADGRWFGAPMDIYLEAGTYWIALNFGADIGHLVMYYDTGGSDLYFSLGGGNSWISDADLYSRTDSTRSYSLRASVLEASTDTPADFDISPNPTSYDDEFKVTNSGSPIGTWTTLGAPTSHNTNSTVKSHYYVKRNSAGGNPSWSGIYKAIPSFPFTVTAKLSDQNSVSNYGSVGLFVGESTPGKLEVLLHGYDGGLNATGVFQYSNPTTYSSTVSSSAVRGGPPIYLRCIVTSSTDITWQYSVNGSLWRTIVSARNPSFTIGSVGLAASGNSADSEGVFDWIRFGSDVVQDNLSEWSRILPSISDDPLIRQFGAPNTDFDFNTTSLTGLTGINTPTASNSNTTAPSHLYIKVNGGGNPAGYYIATPGSYPFTAVAKLSNISPPVGIDYFSTGAFFVGQSTPGNLELIQLMHFSDWVVASEYWSNPTTYSSTNGSNQTVRFAHTPLWFAARMANADDLEFWYSFNGYTWRRRHTKDPSFTVGSVGIMAHPNQSTYNVSTLWDYLRIWNSSLSFVE